MYLLDTHTFLWFIDGDSRLSDVAQSAIKNPNHVVSLSLGSLWEIAIKVGLGRLEIGMDFATLVQDHITGNQIQRLPIDAHHLDVYKTLPFHHRDPFDRLVLAQALAENYTIISKDAVFQRYDVDLLW